MRRNQRRKNEFLASKKGLFTTEKTLNHEKTLDEPVLDPKNEDNNSGENLLLLVMNVGIQPRQRMDWNFARRTNIVFRI